MKLSVCMIVKDEESTLARALGSIASFADEIVIVDTGSGDNTVKIARLFTDKIYYFEWCNDFSAARNFSFQQATGDFLMWLDADDYITEENALKILQLKQLDFDVAFLRYAAAFDGDVPTFIYERERIFRKSLKVRWQGAVHEVVVTPQSAKIIHSDACIFHGKVKSNNPLRNLQIYQRQIAGGGRLDARHRFYYGRELFFNGMYVESIAVLNDYLSCGGWVENEVEACRTLYWAHMRLGQEEAALSALVRAFTLSYPRAEDCCALAAAFERKGDLQSAIWWYKCALNSTEGVESGGFLNVDYQKYIPAIRLCIIYDRLGDYQTANAFNELAGSAKPNDKSYLHNKNYFQTKLTER